MARAVRASIWASIWESGAAPVIGARVSLVFVPNNPGLSFGNPGLTAFAGMEGSCRFANLGAFLVCSLANAGFAMRGGSRRERDFWYSTWISGGAVLALFLLAGCAGKGPDGLSANAAGDRVTRFEGEIFLAPMKEALEAGDCDSVVRVLDDLYEEERAYVLLMRGVLHGAGECVPRDMAAARGYFEQAAALGNILAFASLGRIHAHGLGVAKDGERARYWYRGVATWLVNTPSEERSEVLGWITQNSDVDPDLRKVLD